MRGTVQQIEWAVPLVELAVKPLGDDMFIGPAAVIKVDAAKKAGIPKGFCEAIAPTDS